MNNPAVLTNKKNSLAQLLEKKQLVEEWFPEKLQEWARRVNASAYF